MSLFDRLLGKKNRDALSQTTWQTPGPGSEQIRVFDKFGRELFVTRDQWRTNILPGMLATNRENAEQLAGIVIGALNDGFFREVLEPARHLQSIDPIVPRGTCVYAIALMKNGDLDAAERVLLSHIEHHGEDGSVLTNLAKVYSARNDSARTEATLWHALEVDPNQENGLGWYAVMFRERSGVEAGIQAWQRVAKIPGSWRAQLWLARTALESHDRERAMAYYRESLSRVGPNAPADCLMQVSGDLGNHGMMEELLQLTEPLFLPEVHGLQVGNNLIKANLELGRIEKASEILNRLYALERPDWKQPLGFWDTEIAKGRIAGSTPIASAPLSVAMLVFEGPAWLTQDWPAGSLFPLRPQELPVISFLGCTAEIASSDENVRQQLSDPIGRMSRALPLFLAELTEFTTTSSVQTLVPIVAAESSGFVVAGAAWPDEQACEYASQTPTKCDYIVTLHISAEVEPWTVRLRCLNVADRSCLASFNAPLSPDAPEEGAHELADFLRKFLTDQTDVKMKSPPSFYRTPTGAAFGDYLLRLEQLLAVRCGGLPDMSAGFLYGERDIVDGNVRLCLDCKHSVLTRSLLAATLAAMNKVRPDVVAEYGSKVSSLHSENPLEEPAQSELSAFFGRLAAN